MPTYFSTTFAQAPLGALPVQAVGRNPMVADLNGDGKLDLLQTYFLLPMQNQAVGWRAFLGDGAGGFTEATTTVFPGGAPRTVWPTSYVQADLNGDGRQDLFAAEWGEDQQPFPGGINGLALSQPGGIYLNATSRLPQTVGNTHHVAGADIDGDGDTDILVVDSRQGNSAYFLINNGAGQFTQDTTRAAIASPPGNFGFTNSIFFDYSGDGRPDLLLTTHTGTTKPSMLYINDGTGRFTGALSTVPTPTGIDPASNSYIESLVAVDLNGDGRLDLITGWQVNSYASGRLQALINDGAGGFRDETATYLEGGVTLEKEPDDLRLVDVNGDGVLDLVTSFGDRQPIWLGDGTGRFIRLPVSLLDYPAYSTAADVNGDGRMDFVEGSYTYDGKEWLRIHLGVDPGTNQTGTAASEGFMGDNDAETIYAGAGNDVIVGGGGDDYLRGEDGDDRIAGGDGFDDTHGNMGNDTVSGGLGPDWVVGGKDNDLLFGEQGDDIVYGNLGDDTCEGGDGADIVRGGQGNDIVKGGAGDDWLAGDRGDDTLTGGAGADIFHTHGDAGLDRVLDFSRAEGDRVYLLAGTTYTVVQEGADVAINMTGGGKMVLVGVQLASLTGDWIFGA